MSNNIYEEILSLTKDKDAINQHVKGISTIICGASERNRDELCTMLERVIKSLLSGPIPNPPQPEQEPAVNKGQPSYSDLFEFEEHQLRSMYPKWQPEPSGACLYCGAYMGYCEPHQNICPDCWSLPEHEFQTLRAAYMAKGSLAPHEGSGFDLNDTFGGREPEQEPELTSEQIEQQEKEYRAMDSNDEPILPPEPCEPSYMSIPDISELIPDSMIKDIEEALHRAPEPEPKSEMWTTLDGIEHDITSEPFCRFSREELEKHEIVRGIEGSIFEILSEQIVKSGGNSFSLRRFLLILEQLEKG